MFRISTIGHLGQDASVNQVNGKNVINFSVAYTEKFKDAQGVEVNKTTWLSCAYWTERINLALYLKKGTRVYVEGKPEAKIYFSKENKAMPQLHVRISSLELLSSANTQQQQPATQQDEFLSQPNGFEQTEEIPF